MRKFFSAEDLPARKEILLRIDNSTTSIIGANKCNTDRIVSTMLKCTERIIAAILSGRDGDD